MSHEVLSPSSSLVTLGFGCWCGSDDDEMETQSKNVEQPVISGLTSRQCRSEANGPDSACLETSELERSETTLTFPCFNGAQRRRQVSQETASTTKVECNPESESTMQAFKRLSSQKTVHAALYRLSSCLVKGRQYMAAKHKFLLRCLGRGQTLCCVEDVLFDQVTVGERVHQGSRPRMDSYCDNDVNMLHEVQDVAGLSNQKSVVPRGQLRLADVKAIDDTTFVPADLYRSLRAAAQTPRVRQGQHALINEDDDGQHPSWVDVHVVEGRHRLVQLSFIDLDVNTSMCGSV